MMFGGAWIGEHIAYHLGFAMAGAAMIWATFVLVTEQHTLGNIGMPPGRLDARLTPHDWRDVAIWTIGSIALVVNTLGLWGFVGSW
jgi:hypothetical protein